MQIVPPIKLPPVMTSSLTILRAKFVGGQPHFQFAQCILPPLFLWRWFLDQGFYTKEHFRPLNADNGILVLPGIADAAGDGGRERRIQPGKQH